MECMLRAITSSMHLHLVPKDYVRNAFIYLKCDTLLWMRRRVLLAHGNTGGYKLDLKELHCRPYR